MHNIKKSVLLSILMIMTTTNSFAIPVEDFMNEANTRATYLKEIESTLNEVKMIKNQMQQLQYASKNSQALTNQQWDNAQKSLDQLSNSVNQNQSLNYSMSDVDQQFKQRYPGYTTPATTDYANDYKTRVQTNQATMNGVLDQMNTSYAQQQQETNVDQSLAMQAQNPAGQMQALQIGNEIAAEEIAQLQKIKATIIAAVNAEVEYYAYQSQQDATKQKSVDAVVNSASENFPAYQDNPQFGLIPQFGNGA